MNSDWSKDEVKKIVEDYFIMLQHELGYQSYNKSEYRKRLLPKLENRSEGSVEFKHQNISAALINMGLPFIKGYKPRFNYQKNLIEEIIADYIKENRFLLEPKFDQFSSSSKNEKKEVEIDFTKLLVDVPSLSEMKEDEPLFRPVKINYLEREQNNRSLGEAGEELIIKYEKWRLAQAGKLNLSEKIEWVSKELGDGTGFDILSKNVNGTDRYIEVKTTKLSADTPIYVTRTEVSFAKLKEKEFYLYRMFNFDSLPAFFMKTGKYEGFCKLQPQTFKGFF